MGRQYREVRDCWPFQHYVVSSYGISNEIQKIGVIDFYVFHTRGQFDILRRYLLRIYSSSILEKETLVSYSTKLLAAGKVDVGTITMTKWEDLGKELNNKVC